MSRARDNANLSPTIADARMPNLTGDVTTVEGAVATTIATDAVDIAMLSATGTADGTTFLRGDNAWAAAGGGTILQTLNFTNAYALTNTGTTPLGMQQSPGDGGGLWEPSITPSATSSKVLITASIPTMGSNSTQNDGRGTIRMLTDIAGAGYVEKLEWTEIIGGYDHGNSGLMATQMISFTYLQSPSTTSAFKVKMQFETNGGGSTTVFVNTDSRVSTMTLQEISG